MLIFLILTFFISTITSTAPYSFYKSFQINQTTDIIIHFLPNFPSLISVYHNYIDETPLTKSSVEVWDISHNFQLVAKFQDEKPYSYIYDYLNDVIAYGYFIPSGNKQDIISLYTNNTFLKSLETIKTSSTGYATVNDIIISDTEVISSIFISHDDNSKKCYIKMWNIGTWKSEILYEIEDTNVYSLVLNDNVLVTLQQKGYEEPYDFSIVLFDIEKKKILFNITTDIDFVGVLDISRDGKTLVAGFCDGSVRIYDLKTGELINAIVFKELDVNQVLVSPNSQYIAVLGEDEYKDKTFVYLIDSKAEKVVQKLVQTKNDFQIEYCSFSDDDSFLALGTSKYDYNEDFVSRIDIYKSSK